MNRKTEIIARIESLLRPPEMSLCTYFVQDEKRPGMWTRKGESFTTAQARAVKARRKYFIKIARREGPPISD